ncbi:MAG: hypothetical protein K2K29_03830, partial [Muribaculaceae bacterium]|nr:hypothetical protein [Muribaculaceae bacterium]
YILGLSVMTLMAGCSENAWNDHLEGFEVPPVAGGVTNAEYVLTTDDYKNLANLDVNKALAESLGESDALKAIGTNGCFLTQEQAVRYIPALLESTDKNLPYFTYNNGSAVKLTFNVSDNVPEEVQAINAGTLTYTLTEQDYQMVWDSEEDYINGFAPELPAAGSLPAILKRNLQAEAGQYAVVSYNEAQVNPVFGNPGASDDPAWEITSVISQLQEGDNASINGIITAINARGFVVSDNSGSLLCYQASGFDQNAVSLYSQVTVKGAVSSYNKGLQIGITSENYEIVGEGEYTYPAPKEVSGADMDAAILATEPFAAQYVTLTGTVSISGNYYNINVPGAETAIGSGYMVPDYIKAQLEDGKEYRFCGYFMAISGGKYYNIVITSVAAPGSKVASRVIRRAPAATVSTEVKNAIYRFDGSVWTTVSDLMVLNPSDYSKMGLSYLNFSGAQPEQYLPTYLKVTFPYAAEEAVKTVAYLYHTSDGDSYQAREYTLTGGDWKVNAGQTTCQFVKTSNEWVYNPSVVIDLPYVRNSGLTYEYFMEIVKWVYEDICVPMGDTSMTSGKYFLDYRANAEFYSGASAYYGNVDIRATSALQHVPDGYTGYDGLTDEEITLLIKKRFSVETLPVALSVFNPDAEPVEGMQVTYTVNFTAYDNAPIETSIVYEVIGNGQFRYLSSTWVEEGQDADW